MAFVYEIVPDADRERFNALGLKDALREPMIAGPFTRWAIDRERDAILVGLGGGMYGEAPMLYNLMWQGHCIGIELFTVGEGNAQSGIGMHHRIRALNIPQTLSEQKAQILQLIRDALYAKNSDNGRIPVNTFEIAFPQPTFY